MENGGLHHLKMLICSKVEHDHDTSAAAFNVLGTWRDHGAFQGLVLSESCTYCKEAASAWQQEI
jgi:hypothetical protein